MSAFSSSTVSLNPMVYPLINHVNARGEALLHLAPDINRVAARIGIEAGDIQESTNQIYDTFIDHKTNQILNSLYDEGAQNPLPFTRENMRPIIHTALERHVLGANIATFVDTPQHAQPILIVDEMRGNTEAFTFTGVPIGEGTFAIVDQISKVGQQNICVLKMARLTLEGNVNPRAEEDIQQHTHILNRIFQQAGELDMENIEPLPQAIVATVEGRHGYIPAEVYAGNMGNEHYKNVDVPIKIERCRQIISGLKILDAVGLRWGDNKLGNVFVTQGNNPRLRLGDFGGARFYGEGNDGLYLPNLQELLSQNVITAQDILQVTHTSEYLTTPHLERLVQAVHHENGVEYTAAQRQIELFGNATMLFELLTGEAIANMIPNEYPIINEEVIREINLDVEATIQGALEEVAIQGDWQAGLQAALDFNPGENYVSLQENTVFAYPPDDATAGWRIACQDQENAQDGEASWVTCQQNAEGHWMERDIIEHPIIRVEGNHFAILEDPVEPLNPIPTYDRLSLGLFIREYIDIQPVQKAQIDALYNLFQRACSPNPTEDFAIDNANFLNEVEAILVNVGENA